MGEPLRCYSLSHRVNEPFGVQRSHASGTGAGARLTVDMVHNIAAGKDARYTGFGRLPLEPAAYLDIAGSHIEMPCKYAGIGLVADRDENAV